jgi:hypothetical protein
MDLGRQPVRDEIEPRHETRALKLVSVLLQINKLYRLDALESLDSNVSTFEGGQTLLIGKHESTHPTPVGKDLASDAEEFR